MLRSFVDYLAVLWDAARTVLTAPGPQRWHRLRFLLLFSLVYPPMFAIVQLTLALDHLLYPGFREVQIERPVFIVGNMRTGTTHLYRTMARDRESFVSFRLLDLLFPSIVMKRCAAWVGRVDTRLGGPGERLLQRLDEAFLPVFSHIHQTGWAEFEEDEYLLYHMSCSATLHMMFPHVRRFRRLLYLDIEADPRERQRIVARYAGLARRHLYHLGPGKTLLSKNPYFTCKIDALNQAFPDARFAMLVRSPLQTVPSTASMAHFVWHHTGALPPGTVHMEPILEICEVYYRHARERFAELGPERAHTIDYRELVADMPAAVRELCAQLDLPVSDALAEILAEQAARERPHKSRHAYSLADWGLTETQLRSRFQEVFAELGE